jgi:methylmalonyl-CoA/ethylmalonyl-CoA epimerase
MSDRDDTIDALAPVVERFDHVSVAVADIDATAPLLRLLGATYFDGGTSPKGDFTWSQYSLPGWGTLELIAPLVPDPDHFIHRFLRERGEGLHHLTFKVFDIAEATRRATELGFLVTGYDDSFDDWKEAFVHPKSANGVLIQLAEFPDKDA